MAGQRIVPHDVPLSDATLHSDFLDLVGEQFQLIETATILIAALRSSHCNRGLANVWDLSADYQITRSFSTTLYYGHAWGKGVISAIYPNDPNRQLIFLETNFHFQGWVLAYAANIIPLLTHRG